MEFPSELGGPREDVPYVGAQRLGGDARILAPRRTRADILVASRTHATRLLLLVGCLGIIAWYVSLALHVDGNNDNDAAYYLGVARHMARTGRFEENIVWQFLDGQGSVIHRPFTYWQGLTSVCLVPVLFLFRGPHAPFVFMALISGGALLLLWYLVTTAAPLAHPLAQGLALFVFGLSPAMTTYRVDTDSVPLMHLWLIGSLLALSRNRLKTALYLAYLMVWTRGDGAVLCAIIWAGCLLTAFRAASSRWSSMMPLLGTAFALFVVYTTSCFLLHGSVPPPLLQRAPRLVDYFDMYAFDASPAFTPWRARFRLPAMGNAFWTAVGNLQSTSFSPLHGLWLAVVLMFGWRGVRWRWIGTIWCLLFLGSTLVVLLSGPLFSPWRSLFSMLPVTALAGGATLDELLERVRRAASPKLGRRTGSLIAAGVGIALLGTFWKQVRPLPRPTQLLATWEKNLRAVTPTLRGHIVASSRPWSVIANTDSPAVMIPGNGADAVEAALKLYGVRWLILSDEPCLRKTEEVCAQIRTGKLDRLGSLQLTEFAGAGDLRLFRVVERGD